MKFKMDSSKIGSGTNLSDSFPKRLCSKGKSNSISSTVIKLHGSELVLGK